MTAIPDLFFMVKADEYEPAAIAAGDEVKVFHEKREVKIYRGSRRFYWGESYKAPMFPVNIFDLIRAIWRLEEQKSTG